MYIYQTMSNNFGYIDIILLAMIAGFIILRLRNIIGRKTGHQDKTFSNFSEKKFEKFAEDVIKKQTIESDILDGPKKVEFLKGAEIAYESIISEFAKGDIKKLKNLLDKKMTVEFEKAIDLRNQENINSELTFVGMKESKLEKYEKIKTELFATVKFVCEIISVKRKDNKIIEGSPDKIKIVTDYWKFSKSSHNNNPNWYLSEIISK